MIGSHGQACHKVLWSSPSPTSNAAAYGEKTIDQGQGDHGTYKDKHQRVEERDPASGWRYGNPEPITELVKLVDIIICGVVPVVLLLLGWRWALEISPVVISKQLREQSPALRVGRGAVSATGGLCV